MTNHEDPTLTNYIHQGYMDGLHGRDPNSKLEHSNDYTDGYLTGAIDRDAFLKADPNWAPPKFLGPCKWNGSVPFKRNDTVQIPKGTTVHTIHYGTREAGRTYSVKLHDVYDGVPAHRNYQDRKGGIVRPTAPEALWPGKSGYWSTANLNDLAGK